MPALVFHPPPCKSAFARALLLALLRRGRTRLDYTLEEGATLAADVQVAVDCVRRLGAELRHGRDANGAFVEVESRGWPRAAPVRSIDCGESATMARMLSALTAALGGEVRVDGGAQLRRRQLGASLVDVLQGLGASIEWNGEAGCLPLRVVGRTARTPLDSKVDTAHSSQGASGLLLALGVHGARLQVDGPPAYLRLTAAWMRAFGVDLRSEGDLYVVDRTLPAGDVALRIPADPSAACFFLAYVAGHRLEAEVRGLEPNGLGAAHPDLAFFADLAALGVRVEEQASGLRVDARAASLDGDGRGLDVELVLDERPDAVAPLTALLSSRRGCHVLRSSKLRHKESDRIQVLVDGLRRLGFAAEAFADGFRFEGRPRGPRARQLDAARGSAAPLRVASAGDHRMAMAFRILASIHGVDVAVDDEACVDKSFPSFQLELRRWDELRARRS
ncbi:MAG TPA: hypothetical protein PKE00_01495 [Planctomycetota bacterium]|nr:hypothetical protein [Planctomycetota bacterium]